MKNIYRTYNCNEIREKNVGEEIRLAGWVDTIRDLGGVLFIDLRDSYGITQVVVSGDEEKVDFASKIPLESVITVSRKSKIKRWRNNKWKSWNSEKLSFLQTKLKF